ncbi:hypothetical protein M409DRAFT_30111 [Zasmidium cellare ATCC 36951]|uniref:GST N-terminal domain-containing protein n=1 Tax=Zasmidium cellare ATCC 36951 TaxID=1080233 RepID=A0A6A6BXN5_ZASCE|nr:uncharacterized protein M409DRAFT_30111 [Zasmidium cellare ATCC 36951]KAF2159363.1 hypothetical protein M409DRAFT_30111 [Zasmidium cellare ATCC 36951]
MATAYPDPARNESAKITVRVAFFLAIRSLERSRAQRLLWLLEECRIPYEIKAYKRVDHKAPPEMKQVHPLGKAPVLTIEEPGKLDRLAMAESGTVFEYLVDYYAPHLAPKRFQDGREGNICGETRSWLRYRYYMHYTEGSLMSLLMRIHVLGEIKSDDSTVESTRKHELREVQTYLTFLESQINSAPQGGPYLCGNGLTAADIMISLPLLVLQSTVGLNEYPGLGAYVERLTGRPGYKASIKRAETASGEKYALI